MSDWHGCCNTTFREKGAFRVLSYSALRRPVSDFGGWRSRERECGYSLAFSVAPNAALSRPLYYDRRRLDHRLAEGRYVGAIALISLDERNIRLRPVRPAEIFSAASQFSGVELRCAPRLQICVPFIPKRPVS